MSQRSSNKKKANSREHAQNRAQAEQNLPEPPDVGTEQQRSHGRFPNETPLTGEDRPVDRPGGKKE